MIDIRQEDISLEELVMNAKNANVGAVVSFLGTVRDDGIVALEIEAYKEAALSELWKIAKEAEAKFGLSSVDVVHRTGHLMVGDLIVAIVCSASHRKEAFLGCSYIIDEIKKRAPIWKKEIGKTESKWI